jgi:predicted DNA-binding transcriptional regulator AlpA
MQTQPKRNVRKRANALDAGGSAPRITAGINEFARISGLSRMTIWRLTSSGELKSFKIGKKKLIILQSYYDLMARRQAAEAQP